MLRYLYERRKALEPGFRDERIEKCEGAGERIVES
jgi:hypothetical protein